MPLDLKSHIFQALLNAWGFIRALAPYLASGILLAALLRTFVPQRPIRLLLNPRWWIIPAAGVAGLISPACTYGTAPVLVEMVRQGAPIGAAASFLVASSLVNPQMFLLTAGALGLPVAVAQAAGSLGFAVGIGALVAAADARGIGLVSAQSKPREPHRHSHNPPAPWPRRLAANAIDLVEFVGFYFVIGTIVAALVSEFVPSRLIAAMVGEGRWWATPLAAIVSVPVYVCGGGTIPFLADAHKVGMSTAAILAFLIAGPATRITALAALATVFRKRTLVVYVLLVCLFAAVAGAAIGGFVRAGTAVTP